MSQFYGKRSKKKLFLGCEKSGLQFAKEQARFGKLQIWLMMSDHIC